MVRLPRRSDLSLQERIGIGVSGPIEDAMEWAADNDVHFIETRPVSLQPDGYTDEDVSRIQELGVTHDITLGLHSLSGVNTAATEPHVESGVDQYLRSYIDLAGRLRTDNGRFEVYVVVHPGYHFTADESIRREKSITRLREIGSIADSAQVPTVMCNMNPESERSEIQYLASDLEDCLRYEEAVLSSDIEWAFNAPHAHLGEGIQAYVEGLDVDRFSHVRLNDNDGIEEKHLIPGTGTIDFDAVFASLEDAGFSGQYILRFGSRSDMLESRNRLLDAA
ncbi:MAG: sugar phosphate isomerase/epimerase family protein [Halodesulfurarchaeum sp.]